MRLIFFDFKWFKEKGENFGNFDDTPARGGKTPSSDVSRKEDVSDKDIGSIWLQELFGEKKLFGGQNS